MAELNGNGKPAMLSWERVAHIATAALIALGGYLWNQTTHTVAELQVQTATQEVNIARLQEWRLAQEQINARLSSDLKDINDKLDDLLALSRTDK